MFLMTGSDFAFSQKKDDPAFWHLTIIDSATAKGIERVTISINRRNSDFITGINGTIDINKTLINPNDSIKISSIGYNTRLLKPGIDHKFPDTIKLFESITLLKEVKISALNSIQTITIGNIKKSYNKHWHPETNDEFAVYIPNEKKITGTIISVQYFVNDALHGIEMPFKVEIYSKSKNSIFPDQELTKDSIIVYNAKRERRLSIDISKYNIQIPEDGFFVVFETLSPSFYDNDLVWLDKKEMVYGKEMYKVPGIDYDNNDKNAPIVVFDQKPNKGVMYSVTRRDKAHWDDWTLFREGIDFAIGAIINPD